MCHFWLFGDFDENEWYLIILGHFLSFWRFLVKAYVAVLRWCFGFLGTSLAISELSALLCIGGVLRLLFPSVVRSGLGGYSCF